MNDELTEQVRMFFTEYKRALNSMVGQTAAGDLEAVSIGLGELLASIKQFEDTVLKGQ